jgi:hypothetical protein
MCLGSLVNSYLPGPRSIPRARRFLLDPHARRALAIAPAARSPPLGARAWRQGRESSRAWRHADFPAQSSFTGCTVRCHEDVPRHIYGLFEALGIQYRWVLTRGPLGRELLKTEDLVIDDAKEGSWMVVYEHERDLLEDTVYRRLASLWSELSDAYAVSDQHGPAQLLCAQQVWEALLTAFPLKHKHMQPCPSCP